MAPDSPQEQVFTGIAASPGIAHGMVFLLNQQELTVPNYSVDTDRMPAEIERLDTALVETRRQIQQVQNEIRSSIGEDEARIFDAHLLVLEDQALIGESIRDMEAGNCNIENALWAVGQKYIAAFSQIDDEYLRERASDIRDVLRRLMSNLTGEKMQKLSDVVKNRVLVSHDVSPSDSASMDRTNLLGIVTDAGSKTSHAVIVARSLSIPAVVGLGDFTSKVAHDVVVLVDGYEGKVIVNPSEATLFKYGKKKDERRSIEKRLIEFAKGKDSSRTRDGYLVNIMANIEKAEEAAHALEIGADGIGLFRSEFLFMSEGRHPSEEQQFEQYKSAAEAMDGLPVVIRTLDLGGDKLIESIDVPTFREMNPFLGYRAIRFCLDHESIFMNQLRALLRASAFGDVRIMYPMISGVGELDSANNLLEAAKEELRSKGQAFNEEIQVGSMIEIPSAAIAADTLLAGSAFFSIGTNDLIQYLLAVDRMNDRVAHLYEPTHPAVIRTFNMIVEAARRGNIGVSVCGEVAGDPVMVPLLIGLGIETLSMSPSLLPNVKFIVQNTDMSEAKELAAMALAESNPTVVLERLLDFYVSRMDQL